MLPVPQREAPDAARPGNPRVVKTVESQSLAYYQGSRIKHYEIAAKRRRTVVQATYSDSHLLRSESPFLGCPVPLVSTPAWTAYAKANRSRTKTRPNHSRKHWVFVAIHPNV